MIEFLFIMAALFIGAAFGYHMRSRRERWAWQEMNRRLRLMRDDMQAFAAKSGADDKDNEA